jgi:hypothetical protein
MASELNFSLGPELSRYIATQGMRLKLEDLQDAQLKHYGCIRIDENEIQSQIRRIGDTAVGFPATMFSLGVELSPLTGGLPLP